MQCASLPMSQHYNSGLNNSRPQIPLCSFALGTSLVVPPSRTFVVQHIRFACFIQLSVTGNSSTYEMNSLVFSNRLRTCLAYGFYAVSLESQEQEQYKSVTTITITSNVMIAIIATKCKNNKEPDYK